MVAAEEWAELGLLKPPAVQAQALLVWAQVLLVSAQVEMVALDAVRLVEE